MIEKQEGLVFILKQFKKKLSSDISQGSISHHILTVIPFTKFEELVAEFQQYTNAGEINKANESKASFFGLLKSFSDLWPAFEETAAIKLPDVKDLESKLEQFQLIYNGMIEKGYINEKNKKYLEEFTPILTSLIKEYQKNLRNQQIHKANNDLNQFLIMLEFFKKKLVELDKNPNLFNEHNNNLANFPQINEESNNDSANEKLKAEDKMVREILIRFLNQLANCCDQISIQENELKIQFRNGDIQHLDHAFPREIHLMSEVQSAINELNKDIKEELELPMFMDKNYFCNKIKIFKTIMDKAIKEEQEYSPKNFFAELYLNIWTVLRKFGYLLNSYKGSWSQEIVANDNMKLLKNCRDDVQKGCALESSSMVGENDIRYTVVKYGRLGY